MTENWTDDGRINGLTQGKLMLLSHILTIRVSDVASLVECRPVVLEEIA